MTAAAWITLGLATASFVVSSLVVSRVPSRIAVHWDAAGRADGFASRTLCLSGLPSLIGAVALLFLFPSRKVVDNTGYQQGVDSLLVAVAGLMLAVHVLIVVASLEAGHEISMVWLMALLGVFFMVCLYRPLRGVAPCNRTYNATPRQLRLSAPPCQCFRRITSPESARRGR